MSRFFATNHHRRDHAPATLGAPRHHPTPTILAIAALGALLATSAPPLAAQTFDPGDESCNGKPEGTACWMELANHPQCYLWNPGLALGASATWGAECTDGLAQGMGTITWIFEGDKIQFANGLLSGGQRSGRWVILRSEDSSGTELFYAAGPYVDGREYGRWVFRFPGGHTEQGPFVDAKRQGQWVLQLASGYIEEGPYVDDARHGRWVFRDSNGNTCAAQYVRGEQQGACK